MNKYLFLYRNPPAPDFQPSPEQMQQMLAAWTQWKASFGDRIVDLGDGLEHAGKLLADGQVTDGPLPETKEIIGGYSIIAAESWESALEVARACPATQMPDSIIEIRKLAGY